MEQSTNENEQWLYTLLTTDFAYNLFELFKQNAVNFRT